MADDLLTNLQKEGSGKQVLQVGFKEPVDIELLKSLKDVTAVTQLSTVNYQLSTTNPEALRKQLMQLSLQNNLNIVSLQSETNSLEDIFRSLTTAVVR